MRKSDVLRKTRLVSLDHSINTIKNAQRQLDGLSNTMTTPAAIVSQIRIYNLLLHEIARIRREFARELSGAPSFAWNERKSFGGTRRSSRETISGKALSG